MTTDIKMPTITGHTNAALCALEVLQRFGKDGWHSDMTTEEESFRNVATQIREYPKGEPGYLINDIHSLGGLAAEYGFFIHYKSHTAECLTLAQWRELVDPTIS